jgi:hypothetical protein
MKIWRKEENNICIHTIQESNFFLITIDQKENSAHFLISDQSCHNFVRRFLLGFTENKYCRHTSSFRGKFGPIPGNIASKVRELFTST